MWRGVLRLVFAVFVAGLAAVFFRFQNSENTPPLEGGWRELKGPDFR